MPSALLQQPIFDHPEMRHLTGTATLKHTKNLTNDTLEQNDTVLEALVGETHHAASRTAIVASWTNALSAPEIAVSAPTVHALIPDDPAIMITMRRWITSSTTLSPETLHCTQAFFKSLTSARRSFNIFSAEAKQIGFVRAGILHRSPLATTWQIAIKHAKNALQAQSSEPDLNIPQIYSDNALALQNLIDQVKSGDSPCLNLDGSIRLPDLPNQRRHARRYLLENCLVKTQKQSFTAFARDISIGGIGLDRVPQLSVGHQVTIKLPTGRTFSGRVQWYKNASAGIHFDTQLNASDPLLSA